MLLVLIFLGIQVQRQSAPLPESSPAPGTTASPNLNTGPPLVETTESATPVEPTPAGKPGPGPTAALAPPAPLVAPQREKPTLKEERYLVIAATFSQLEQARTLTQRLKGKKYQAQVTKTTVKGKTTYLVRLGPFTDKKKAEEVAKRLKTQEHLTPRLAQLKPKPAPAAASPGGPR
jgi:cell division septation protein DedD